MPLTIVMYHYVRELKRSRFSEIKGLTLEGFRGQLAYLRRNFRVVTAAEVVGAVTGQDELPHNAALLTFDDGYVEHFTNVFPLLHEHRVQGLFFPPGKCVLEDCVLDVNKIHFVLASVSDKNRLVEALRTAVAEHAASYALRAFEDYWVELARASRFDTAEVVFVKRMLQRALPEECRKRITDDLFRRHVSSDEASFARELYMSADQLRMMVREGMYVGSHGYDHYWMNRLNRDEQDREVSMSLSFLREIGAPTKNWIMCYPYGATDESLETVLSAQQCVVGLTTRVAVADINADHPLRLPRLDTNDLPTTEAGAFRT